MNIVFDLGGVLFRWEPEKLMASHFPDPREASLIDRHLHSHPDWAELDRGTLSYDDAARRGAERSGLDEGRIRRFLDGAASHLTPKEDTVALLGEISKAGYPLYLLSNMHTPVVPYLETHSFMTLFDGKIYSCRVNQTKPDRDIYRTLLERFSLVPEDTLFIDDSPVNLPEPEALGINTIRFISAADCREKLRELGVTL